MLFIHHNIFVLYYVIYTKISLIYLYIYILNYSDISKILIIIEDNFYLHSISLFYATERNITCMYLYFSFFSCINASYYILDYLFVDLINLSNHYIIIRRNTIIDTATLKRMEKKEDSTSSLDEGYPESNHNDANNLTINTTSVPKMMVAKHIFHSTIFHPLLRQWQSMNTNNFNSCNLMYPVFVR